ncbi:MAG: c-type cytochrome, partial [Planctomycetes bacterium]|nr:c-type cytochrome [Planctomycetota bacterium]
TVFKDGLSFPTGVMAWRDGVLICCPPDVLYAEDRDGDGRADHEVILFQGFGTGNQQHRANGFRWGLDNHVYGANGDSGGRIRSVATGAVVDISGRDFRMLPDAGVLDPQSGETQFGRSRDDWGNWFGGNNSNPLWHFVLGDHYLRRNPHVAAHTARVAVPEQAGKARVFPRMPVPARFNTPSDASHLTSACSFAVYRDTILGPAFSGDLFFCEPSHGLVHRQTPTPSGVTFTSRRAPGEEDAEFLASSDPWFRPTMVRTGPDGALWISDMARLVIEHPEWIPDDWEKRLDLRAGKDLGRIYRVLPIRGQPRPVPRFDALDANELANVLESPNGVQRDMAHRLLVHRGDLSVAPRLARMTEDAERPTARLHALCALDGLGALNAEHVRAALDDVHPGVRRHAVRLCEGRIDGAPRLVEALIARVDDDASQVRLQLACTLGSCDDPRAALALARMAWRDHADPFLRAAILSSLGRKNLATVLDGLERLADGADIPVALLAPLGQTAVGVGLAPQAARVLEQLLESGDSAANRPLLTLLDAMDRAGMAAANGGPLAKHLASARAALVDTATPTARRVRAVALIGREAAKRDDDMKTLAGLLAPRCPGALQEAAARRLAALGTPRLPDMLIAGWRGHGPHLRATILDLLLQRPEWAQAIVDAVAAGTVRAREIDAARRPVLLRRLPEAARERAARLLERGAPTDRADVIASWSRRIEGLVGDAARGRDVFAKTCGSCHALGGVGRGIGPDLGTLADRSTSTLLVAILDPNRAVEARYLSYDAWTHDGDVHTGLITEESGGSIKLVDLQGNEVNLLRKDIDELRSSGSSQMPEGLEKDLSPEQLTDLLAFVRSRPPPRRSFVGNEPRPVTPSPSNGALALTAARAEIYGASLRYEGTYGNLGFWSGLDDHATWTFDLPAAGTYELQLDYACADGTAGNHVVVSSGDQRVTSKVAGTGTWNDYRTTGIGRMRLPAGRSRLSVFAAKPLRQFLLDLRAVHLVPIRR